MIIDRQIQYIYIPSTMEKLRLEEQVSDVINDMVEEEASNLINSSSSRSSSVVIDI